MGTARAYLLDDALGRSLAKLLSQTLFSLDAVVAPLVAPFSTTPFHARLARVECQCGPCRLRLSIGRSHSLHGPRAIRLVWLFRHVVGGSRSLPEYVRPRVPQILPADSVTILTDKECEVKCSEMASATAASPAGGPGSSIMDFLHKEGVLVAPGESSAGAAFGSGGGMAREDQERSCPLPPQ